VTISRFWWLPVVAAGLLKDRGSRGRWLCVPVLVAVAAAISTVGKVTTRRPRPRRRPSNAPPPIGRLGVASSFPSTHAACAFAIAAWMRPARPSGWLHLMAMMIGYTRVRGRAHYFGDVVAGSTLGYALGRSADRMLAIFVAVVRGVRHGRRRRITCAHEPSSGPCSEQGPVLLSMIDRPGRRAKLLVALALVGIVLSCLHSGVAYAHQPRHVEWRALIDR
jgi:hypothetical protein